MSVIDVMVERLSAAEAEVKRLRAERDAFRKEADEAREQANAFSLDGMALDSELTAYRGAVADLRKLFARGPKYWAHVDEFTAILDKLPKDAP